MILLAGEEFVRAKDALVRAAYRGLLRREPDAAAAAELGTRPFTDPEEASLAETLASFVNSDEFQRTAPEQTRPDFPPSTWARIEIEDLKLWIDIAERVNDSETAGARD